MKKLIIAGSVAFGCYVVAKSELIRATLQVRRLAEDPEIERITGQVAA